MSTTVLRLKRKACSEPADSLVVALKRSKCDETDDTNEVVFKFAATLESESESVKDHIQAVLSKDKASKFTEWRDPKKCTVGKRDVHSICEKLKKENRVAIDKKKLDLLNNRRLILSETLPIEIEQNVEDNSEVRKLFQLYDIIEENEDVKKPTATEQAESNPILCNGQVMIREKTDQYVYDVYIADSEVEMSEFCDKAVGIMPLRDDDIYSGSEESELMPEDSDSNDENNWRNDYPEEEDSNQGSDAEDDDDVDPYYSGGRLALDKLHVGCHEDYDELESDEYD